MDQDSEMAEGDHDKKEKQDEPREDKDAEDKD